MNDSLARLEPHGIWRLFAGMAEIPRPSRHEERIVAWVRALADEHGFPVASDATGNLVVSVPATSGRQAAPTVILQGHLDMVCEKNRDSDHDFFRDPIRPRIDGEWVYATGTTLGADNGIGVVAALAAATDPSVAHGPLELLFTLDEETGLTGAAGLDGSLLQGRLLINMDSEEDGTLFVGCAGGADSLLFLETPTTAPSAGTTAHRLEITGLVGGHSGLNIHENRGNAVKLLTRVLLAACDAGATPQLSRLTGGSMHNAIPREAEAAFYLPDGEARRFAQVLADRVEGFRTELRGVDDGLEVRFEPADDPGPVLRALSRDRLLRLLMGLPHGVLAMSRDIPGLVETSSNLAAIRPEAGGYRIACSSRSSVAPALEGVLASIRSTAELARASVDVHDAYPGWKPNMDSPLLEVVRGVYADVLGRPPEVTAIHAGLECGLLAEKVAGLDMISFGPQIEGAHSPDERVHVPSVRRFWDVLVRLLDRLSVPA